LTLFALSLLALLASGPRPGEVLFYMTGSDASYQSFAAHVDQITTVAPQVFSVDSLGVVWGDIDPRVTTLARQHHVHVVPLVVNPGFDQATIHRLLNSPAARQRALRSFIDLAVAQQLDGWQFDFENVSIADRDSLTAFFREAADSLHAHGKQLSIAVAPSGGGIAASSFAAYMQESWQGAYDLRALAAAGDFVSLMTYAEHGSLTTPGPIAALPWVRDMLDHALALGIPPAKLSLGLPTYSGWWHTVWDAQKGAHIVGQEIGYDHAASLLQQYGTRPIWLADAGVSYAFWPVAGTYEWLFIEDRRSFARKLQLLRDHPGLRGISVWVLGAEDPGVWEAIRRR
jgi:spore germination protein YaaH